MIKSILKIPLSWLGSLEERKLMESSLELKYPPIFILGPPRSGTTLMYQLMIHRYQLSFFTNISDMLNKFPVSAARWGRRIYSQYESSFESNYGRVDGKLAPSEAGGIWNRWFPYESQDGYNYTAAGQLSIEKQKLVYQTVAGIEKLSDLPFVNKNVKHSVRILALNEIFPSSLFLRVVRDPEEIAVSILHGRKRQTTDVSAWWSAMPKEIDQLTGLDVLEQVAGQVYFLEKNITEDLSQIDSQRHLTIEYDRLCNQPQAVMSEIAELARLNNCNLKLNQEMPTSFKKSSQEKKDVSTAERESLHNLLENYYAGESAPR